jgi:monoamine oxidase
VVEGAHRIGGRAYSEEIAPGAWFDLGCSYLHQGDTNPIRPIADTLGITLNHERADLFSQVRGFCNGIPLTEEESGRFGQYYEDCDKAIEAFVSGGEDSSILERIDMENEFFPPYANWMSVINNMDIDETSAADYLDDGSQSTGTHTFVVAHPASLQLDIYAQSGF